MKKKIMTFCLALIGCTAMAAVPAFADDAKPAAVSADELKKALGLSIYLQAGYTYNGNASYLSVDPTTHAGTGSENNLRWLDHKANSFGLDLLELNFAKEPAAGAAGYKVKISAGETAKLIHSAGLGDAGQDAVDITEAYISYIVDAGKGLRIDFGKMGTFVGAEVMEAIDNPNYSRSLLFSYAEPTTHTGLKAGYVFSDNVNAALYIVNGWDNVTDNNTGKTLGASVNVTAGDPFSAYVNYLQGPETADNNHDKRSLLDLIATIKPVKPLSFILNYDLGRQDVTGAAALQWSGISAIVKYDLNDVYSIAVRGESFDDKDGFRTGTVQKLTEETLSLEARLAGGVVLKPEYRHDSSDKESFDNGTKKSQDTIALGVMYRW